jgi:ABC-type glutathione transport system ATPase component
VTGPTAAAAPILEVRDLRRRFVSRSSLHPLRPLIIPAVDGVSFRIDRGRTTALVGESGSGKSTLARLILHLDRADAGEILLDGTPVHRLGGAAFRPWRRRVQMVFQNPLASFDPLYTIGGSVKEVLRLRNPAAPDEEVARLLTEVGLSPRFAGLHPRDISGGELQRAAIARAVAAYPDPSYQGCRLVGRCPLAADRCREPQPLAPVGPGHLARCWRAAAGETAGLAAGAVATRRDP